jgi:hypothetical protein
MPKFQHRKKNSSRIPKCSWVSKLEFFLAKTQIPLSHGNLTGMT